MQNEILGKNCYKVLFLLSQPTRAMPMLARTIVPGAGISETVKVLVPIALSFALKVNLNMDCMEFTVPVIVLHVV